MSQPDTEPYPGSLPALPKARASLTGTGMLAGGWGAFRFLGPPRLSWLDTEFCGQKEKWADRGHPGLLPRAPPSQSTPTHSPSSATPVLRALGHSQPLSCPQLSGF